MYEMRQAKVSTKNKQQTAAEKIREAETVRDELNAALRSAGIVLPSLAVESAAYGDEAPKPLFELGRCNIQVARKLMAVLRREVS